MNIYSDTFKSVIFESVKTKKILQKCQKDPKSHLWKYLKMTLLKVSFLKVKSKVPE